MPACPPVVPGKRQLRVPSSAGLELLSKWVEGAGTELNRVKVKERERVMTYLGQERMSM